jgi:hypothetical protein
MNHESIDALLQPPAISFTICFLAWIVLTSIRRVITTRAQAAVQEKLFARIDSPEALTALTSTESGRLFLQSLTLETPEPTSPHRRILNGMQAGVVLTTFGLAMMYLHHVKVTDGPELLVFGTGALGIGVGFLIAAATSLALSRSLGILGSNGGRAGRG